MTATHGLGTYGNAAGTVTPLDMKMAQLGLIVKTAANTIRAGVFWDGNSTIVSGKSNMSYDVRALTAVLSRGATAGAVLLTNDAVYNVVTTAAPGSNSRYDVVYLWQREYSIDGTDSNPVIGVVQGTAAASPSVPSLSAFPGAIELARILVPAGVTATNSGTTITQTAPFTTVADGIVTARTTTERDAYTPASTDLKARCWVIANGITYVWSGTAWVLPVSQSKMIFTRAAANLASSTSASTLDLATKVLDNGTFTDSAGVFTCAIAGKYAVKLTWNFASNASGTRAVRLVHSVAGARDIQISPGSSLDVTMSLDWGYVDFAVGDTITAMGLQNSGSTLAVAGELTFEKVA